MTRSIGKKRMLFPAALFWGALWGLAEATARPEGWPLPFGSRD